MPEPLPTKTCPNCGPLAALTLGHGVLGEDVCARCSGRFLDDNATKQLLTAELGFTPDFLRALSEHFAGPRRHCAACEGRMSPVTLKSVPAELCLTCGGMWLDAGRLHALSGERYDESTPAEAPPLVENPRVRAPVEKPRRAPDDAPRPRRRMGAALLHLIAWPIMGFAGILAVTIVLAVLPRGMLPGPPFVMALLFAGAWMMQTPLARDVTRDRRYGLWLLCGLVVGIATSALTVVFTPAQVEAPGVLGGAMLALGALQAFALRLRGPAVMRWMLTQTLVACMVAVAVAVLGDIAFLAVFALQGVAGALHRFSDVTPE